MAVHSVRQGRKTGDVTEATGGTSWPKTTAMGESMTTLNINGRDHSVDVANDTPLLWVIREHLRNSDAAQVCVALAPSISTARQYDPARSLYLRSLERRSSRSKVSIPRASTHCSALGSPSRSRSAATANPGRLCKPRHCSPRTLIPPRPKSSRTWTATSAVA